MTVAIISGLAGGIGLFLLGMRLMTEGLRLAAGQALRTILARWTGTLPRGVFSGALITSLVQASGAVTVATIGFVNAGIMKLSQAIAVIYGSNVGTTVTGWLVALVGFDFDIKAFALPAVGVGMLLHMTGGERRYGALGLALVGFGVFFFGIDVMKATFDSLGHSIHLEAMFSEGPFGHLLFVGIGFILTLLMQSSSAAIAVTMTAAAGGVVPLEAAAAAVIGANVGTTSTAMLAVLGATPNAKRVAAGHVAFNLITGAVAFLILPWILQGIALLRSAFGMQTGPVVVLALFHTAFNVLGVLILIPFTRRLVAFLERRFRSAEEDEARPRYLDRTLIGAPVLSINALAMENARVGAVAIRMAKGAISSEGGPGRRLELDKLVLDRLVDAVGEFSNRLQRSNLPPELDDVLPNALRVTSDYTDVAELALAVAHEQAHLPPLGHLALEEEVTDFKGAVVQFLASVDPRNEAYDVAAGKLALEGLKDDYQQLKTRILRAGTEDLVSVRSLVEQLETLGKVHRIARQAEQAARHLQPLRSVLEEGTAGGAAA